MIKTLRVPLSALLCAAFLAIPGQALAAAEPPHYEKESVPTYEAQLSGGQIQEATINRRVGSVRIVLKNGQHVLIHYPAHTESNVKAALEAKGVPVTVLSPSQAKKEASKAVIHHKLRYIAGGILIAVIVIVGAVLLVDRRRKAMAE